MRGDERPAGGPAERGVPEVAGIVTADQLVETGRWIAALQQGDGAIGWPDGHVDAWSHVQCAMALSACGLRGGARRAYAWLAATQRPDGSWPIRTAAGGMPPLAAQSSHAVYPAVGVWHELLVTGDLAFVTRMWPVVAAGVEFALGLQDGGGAIGWRRLGDGSADHEALLADCASMYQGLRCAIALADQLNLSQVGWELAADRLGHAVACHGEAFAERSRFGIDWFYPVLGGAVRGPAADARLAGAWDSFVVPGCGVRSVRDQPWVAGAETCELALAVDAVGDQAKALDLLEQAQRLRAPGGGYWTGWHLRTGQHLPGEQSSTVAATMLLAADALSGASGGAGLFAEISAGLSVPAAAGAEAGCGCQRPLSGPLQHA